MSNFSAAAEADCDRSGIDNYGYLSPTPGIRQHTGQSVLIFENVDVLVRNFTAREVRTGLRCVGSKILSEYQHRLFGHTTSSLFQLQQAGGIAYP